MTDTPEERVGEKTSLYCTECEEETTFVWTVWGGEEYFGYPRDREHGWECTACGSRVRVP